MAKKSGSKGSLSYDYHNMTPDQKQKLCSVCEQFPEIKRDMVAIVLDHHDFDEDKAIDALTSDGGISAFTSWRNQIENNQTKANKNKKKNKKKGKKDGSQVNNNATLSCIDADDSSSLHSSNIDYDPEKEIATKSEDCDDSYGKLEKDSCNNLNSDHTNSMQLSAGSVSGEKTFPLALTSDHLDQKTGDASPTGETNLNCDQGSTYYEANEGDASERNVDTDGLLERNEDHSRHSQKYHHRQRHSSSQHSKSSSVSEDVQSNQSKRGGLVKCTKDLTRQTVSLQRIEMQLGSRLEEASKCLKNKFSDIRKMLDKRQAEVEEELNKVKTEALNLLRSRRDLASELKRKVDRAMAMNESDWNDLRADIKQFVTERKYDEELGKTIWFHWSMDKITEAISDLGEVCPVKNSYSQRQHSSGAPKSPEPSAGDLNTSGKGDENQVSLGFANNSTSHEGLEEGKSTKELYNRNTGQSGPQNVRVFCSTRFQGKRFPANRNRGRGFYRGSGGGGYPRNRYYDSWQQYSGNDRHNDYRKQYHYDRIDYSQTTNDKSVEGQVQESGENNAAIASYSNNARENHGHYRGFDKKPYSNYNRPPRAHNHYGKPQGGGRMRFNSDSGTNSEIADNKVAHQNSQQHKGPDMVNGF